MYFLRGRVKENKMREVGNTLKSVALLLERQNEGLA